MLERLKAEAQAVLEELWKETLTPFPLNAGKVTERPDGYTIHFYDSRMCTAVVPIFLGHSFKEMVRPAVLARVEQMNAERLNH